MKNKLIKIKGYNMMPWIYPSNWIYNFKLPFREWRDRRQRAKYGVAAMDCWSFDYYFYRVLYNGLIQYKKDNNGSPYNLTAKEWDCIIDKMIELVNILLMDESPEDSKLYDKWSETKSEEDREAWYNNTRSWMNYQEECRCELMDLLKKWLPHIWW